MQDLLRQIQQSIQDLPQAQRNVAEYVLENYTQIPFLSVTSMSKAIGVSDTTIIKFCVGQGFDGFASFKKRFTQHVQSEVTMLSNLESRLQNMSGNNILDQILAYDLSNLEGTMNNPINRNNFEPFLDMLDRARNIYVYGLRTSNMQAQYLAASLRIQGYSVIPFQGNGHFADQLCQITPQDLFIAIAFSRYSNFTVKALQYLSQRKVPCASITDSITSPTYGLADLTFICESKSFCYQGSYVACSSLTNAIITAAATRNKEKTTRRLQDVEEALRYFDSFLSYDMQNGHL